MLAVRTIKATQIISTVGFSSPLLGSECEVLNEWGLTDVVCATVCFDLIDCLDGGFGVVGNHLEVAEVPMQCLEGGSCHLVASE